MCIANHWTLLKPIIAYVLIGQLEREKKFSRSASRMQTPAGFFQWFLAKSMVIFKIMCCCMLRINKFGANWGQGETKRRYVNHIFTKRNVKFYKLLSLTQGLRELMIFHHFTFQWPVLLHNLNWTVFATTCVAFLTRKKKHFHDRSAILMALNLLTFKTMQPLQSKAIRKHVLLWCPL